MESELEHLRKEVANYKSQLFALNDKYLKDTEALQDQLAAYTALDNNKVTAVINEVIREQQRNRRSMPQMKEHFKLLLKMEIEDTTKRWEGFYRTFLDKL